MCSIWARDEDLFAAWESAQAQIGNRTLPTADQTRTRTRSFQVQSQSPGSSRPGYSPAARPHQSTAAPQICCSLKWASFKTLLLAEIHLHLRWCCWCNFRCCCCCSCCCWCCCCVNVAHIWHDHNYSQSSAGLATSSSWFCSWTRTWNWDWDWDSDRDWDRDRDRDRRGELLLGDWSLFWARFFQHICECKKIMHSVLEWI